MKLCRLLSKKSIFSLVFCFAVLISTIQTNFISMSFASAAPDEGSYTVEPNFDPGEGGDLDGVNDDITGGAFDAVMEAEVTEGTFDAGIDENEGVPGHPAPAAPDPADGLQACSGSLSWFPSQYTSYYNIWRVDSNPSTTKGLLGTYYDNKDLTHPVTTQIDPNIDKTVWGLGSPDNGKRVSPETFAVKWTGKIQTSLAGDYTFITESKDGVRLWIDDKRVTNNWSTSSGIVRKSNSINLEANKFYNIRVEYFNDRDIASIKLRWQTPNGSGGLNPEVTIPQDVLYPGQSNGLFPQLLKSGLEIPTQKLFYDNKIYAEYYDGKKVNPPVVFRRNESQINYPWTTSSLPDPAINPQEFSVKWLGKVKPPKDGYYRFSVEAKDGVRLWLNDFRNVNRIIDEWKTTNSVRTVTGNSLISLAANTLYDFKLYYYFDGSKGTPDPSIKVYWETINPATLLPDGKVPKRLIAPEEFVSAITPDFRTGLYAQFYDNDGKKGLPVSSRIDSQVNFNDSDLPPISIIRSNYSTVWTGKVKTLPPIGNNSYNTDDQYFFHVDAKDKIEIEVNDNKIMDKGKTDTVTVNRETSKKINLQPGQLYTIKVKHIKSSGDDTFKLYWSREGDPAFNSGPQIIPKENLFSSILLPKGTLQGAGLAHRMYDNLKLSANSVSRSEPRINSADWPLYWSAFSSAPVPTPPVNVPPHPVIQSDTFSDRWVGKIRIPADGIYNFSLNTNGGARTYFDVMDKPLINTWSGFKDKDQSDNKDKNLIGGKTYDYRVEYYENTYPAYITANVTGPGIPVYTHNYNTNDPINYSDTIPSTGPVFYQIAAVGSGGTTYSPWFSPSVGGACGGPTPVEYLKVTQGTSLSDPSFRGTFGTSGLQFNPALQPTDTQGTNWLNPMDIEAKNLISGTPINQYYVTFYDKNPSTGSKLINKGSFITDVQNRIRANPQNGFLLAFRKKSTSCGAEPAGLAPCSTASDKSWVFDGAKNQWIDLGNYTLVGYDICSDVSCSIKLLKAVVLSNPPSIPIWRMYFLSPFTSKSLHTQIYFIDQAGITELESDPQISNN